MEQDDVDIPEFGLSSWVLYVLAGMRASTFKKARRTTCQYVIGCVCPLFS